MTTPQDSLVGSAPTQGRMVSVVIWRWVRLLRRRWRWFYFLPHSAERDLWAKTLRKLRTDDFGCAVAKNLTAFYPIKPNAAGNQDAGRRTTNLEGRTRMKTSTETATAHAAGSGGLLGTTRFLRWIPSMLLFWTAGLAQGTAIASPEVSSAGVLFASAFATGCFCLAAILSPSRYA